MRVSNALLIWDQHPEITQRSFSHHLDVLLSLCFTVINLEEDHASHFTLQHNSKVSHHCQVVSTVCTGVSYGRHCDPWIGDDMCAGPSVSYDSVKPLKSWLISISCPLDSLQHKLWCCMCHQIGNWKKKKHLASSDGEINLAERCWTALPRKLLAPAWPSYKLSHEVWFLLLWKDRD